MIVAMDTMEKYTCVRFRQRTNEYDYVRFTNGGGCSSHLGRIGGMQDITLQKNGCLSSGTILHEIIHALGKRRVNKVRSDDQKLHVIEFI
jgi:Astacin (Peptidase family M12A)